jgi:hypothetical protein
MEELLLDLVHRKWRALAVLACVACIIDDHFEENTIFEAIAGLVFICTWLLTTRPARIIAGLLKTPVNEPLTLPGAK